MRKQWAIFSHTLRKYWLLTLAFWLTMLLVPVFSLSAQIIEKKGIYPFAVFVLFNFCYFLGLVVFYRGALYRYYSDTKTLFLAQLPMAPAYRGFLIFSILQIIALIPLLVTIALTSAVAIVHNIWSLNGLYYLLFAEILFVLAAASSAMLIAMSGRFFYLLLTALFLAFIHHITQADSYGLSLRKALNVGSYYNSESFIAEPYIMISLQIFAVCLTTSVALMTYSHSSGSARLNQLPSKLEWLAIVVLFAAGINFLDFNKKQNEPRFVGFHSQSIFEGSTTRWSSTTPLDPPTVSRYAAEVSRLGRDIESFYQELQIPMPSIQVQHNPNILSPTYLGQAKKIGDALGVTGDFDLLIKDYPSFYHSVLLEIIRMESKDWAMKESQILKWRGLAYAKSGLPRYPQLDLTAWLDKKPFQEAMTKNNWFYVYRELGPCLFDRFAGARFPDLESEKTSSSQLRSFANRQLNISGKGTLIHFLKTLIPAASNSIDDSIAKSLESIHRESQSGLPQAELIRPDFSMDLAYVFPEIQRGTFSLKNTVSSQQSVQIDIAQIDPKGWLFFDRIRTFPYRTAKQEPGFSFVKGKKYYVSMSWLDTDQNCRIYAPWQEVSL